MGLFSFPIVTPENRFTADNTQIPITTVLQVVGGITGPTITNATNATPIVITTNTAHGYHNGMTVEIGGITGNTNANGTFSITVVDSTHFSLDGTAGNGTFGGSPTLVRDVKATGVGGTIGDIRIERDCAGLDGAGGTSGGGTGGGSGNYVY